MDKKFDEDREKYKKSLDEVKALFEYQTHKVQE